MPTVFKAEITKVTSKNDIPASWRNLRHGGFPYVSSEIDTDEQYYPEELVGMMAVDFSINF